MPTATLSYSIADAATVTGLSKQHLREAIHLGQLRAKRSGVDAAGEPAGKYVLLEADLKRYLDNLPEA